MYISNNYLPSIKLLMQGQMYPIPQNVHQMLIYHTTWIVGPEKSISEK